VKSGLQAGKTQKLEMVSVAPFCQKALRISEATLLQTAFCALEMSSEEAQEVIMDCYHLN